MLLTFYVFFEAIEKTITLDIVSVGTITNLPLAFYTNMLGVGVGWS